MGTNIWLKRPFLVIIQPQLARRRMRVSEPCHRLASPKEYMGLWMFTRALGKDVTQTQSYNICFPIARENVFFEMDLKNRIRKPVLLSGMLMHYSNSLFSHVLVPDTPLPNPSPYNLLFDASLLHIRVYSSVPLTAQSLLVGLTWDSLAINSFPFCKTISSFSPLRICYPIFKKLSSWRFTPLIYCF